MHLPFRLQLTGAALSHCVFLPTNNVLQSWPGHRLLSARVVHINPTASSSGLQDSKAELPNGLGMYKISALLYQALALDFNRSEDKCKETHSAPTEPGLFLASLPAGLPFDNVATLCKTTRHRGAELIQHLTTQPCGYAMHWRATIHTDQTDAARILTTGKILSLTALGVEHVMRWRFSSWLSISVKMHTECLS